MELPQPSKFPKPHHWKNHVPNLGSFSRDLHVALPCSGVDVAGFALKALSVPFRAVGVWDVEKRYRDLETHLKGANIYVGQAGNVCSLDWTTIKRPVDVLVSGPPCPPWAGNGVHNAQWDPRADVFVHIMKLAICLIKTGELKSVNMWWKHAAPQL